MNIASYATTIPTLLMWIFVFLRMLIQKEKAKFFALIVICVLMITTQIAAIVQNQLSYNFYSRLLDRGYLYHYNLDR